MTAKDDRNLEQVLAKINGMAEPQRSAVRRMHEVVVAAAPALKPRIWYGMPGYATSASSPVLVFVRNDDPAENDLMSLGVSEKASPVPGAQADGQLRPAAWYFDDVDEATERRVAEIVRAAVSG